MSTQQDYENENQQQLTNAKRLVERYAPKFKITDVTEETRKYLSKEGFEICDDDFFRFNPNEKIKRPRSHEGYLDGIFCDAFIIVMGSIIAVFVHQLFLYV